MAGVSGKKRREPLPGNNRGAKQSFVCCQWEGSLFSRMTTSHRGC